jgi:hypothetical protein
VKQQEEVKASDPKDEDDDELQFEDAPIIKGGQGVEQQRGRAIKDKLVLFLGKEYLMLDFESRRWTIGDVAEDKFYIEIPDQAAIVNPKS